MGFEASLVTELPPSLERLTEVYSCFSPSFITLLFALLCLLSFLVLGHFSLVSKLCPSAIVLVTQLSHAQLLIRTSSSP